MEKKYKFLLVLALIAVLSLGGIFYLRSKIYFSKGNKNVAKMFEIVKGESSSAVAVNLAKDELIPGKWYFLYYLRKQDLLDKILPGKYDLNGEMTIPEIAMAITQKKEDSIKLTFPEGWDSKKMAKRLSENGLDGEAFLEIVNNPLTLKEKYNFLQDPKIKNLEGFLFPDTYFFKKDESAENIIVKMLGDFNTQFSVAAREDLARRNISILDTIIMASILEKEVRSDSDREIASGIFWDRIKNGQALQSCATLAYVLGENKKQYSYEDIQTTSPFNTYLNRGLPPGPICNPGLSAIRASIYPKDSNFNYFLSDPETGKTVFSRTYDEHVANKVKYGL